MSDTFYNKGEKKPLFKRIIENYVVFGVRHQCTTRHWMHWLARKVVGQSIPTGVKERRAVDYTTLLANAAIGSAVIGSTAVGAAIMAAAPLVAAGAVIGGVFSIGKKLFGR